MTDKTVDARGRDVLLGEARAQFQRSVALDPQNADALEGLGRTYRAQREGAPEAVTALTRALQARPWDLDLLGDLIVQRRLNGDREGAYEMLTSLKPRALPSKAKRVETQLAQIDRRESRELADRGDYEQAIKLLADTAGRVGDPELKTDTAKWVAEAEASAKRHADEAQFQRARAAAKAGKYKLAAATYDSVASGADDPGLKERAASAAAGIRKRGL
jgi:tetratricopeptide (TPR) repeat protein